jgi:hypothetical protein
MASSHIVTTEAVITTAVNARSIHSKAAIGRHCGPWSSGGRLRMRGVMADHHPVPGTFAVGIPVRIRHHLAHGPVTGQNARG